MADEWYPVLGDIIYGNAAANRVMYKSLGINRQLLHCQQYSFLDPFKESKITFEAPIPADFEKLMSVK